MKSIIDMIPASIIAKNIIKRERYGDYELLCKDYDLKIVPTTQGSDKYPCIKVTFGDLEELRGNGRFVEFYLYNDYLFFRIFATETRDSRKLSFEKSKRVNEPSLVIGSFGCKIACEKEEYKTLCTFSGKYRAKKTDETKFYYISKSEKI